MAQNAAKGDLALGDRRGRARGRASPSLPARTGPIGRPRRSCVSSWTRVSAASNQKRAEEARAEIRPARRGRSRKSSPRGWRPSSPARAAEWADMPVPGRARGSSSRAPPPRPPAPPLQSESRGPLRSRKRSRSRRPALPATEDREDTGDRAAREARAGLPDARYCGRAGRGAGKRVGLLFAGQARQGGQNPFRGSIQPSVDDGTFYLGPGILRNKNELWPTGTASRRIGSVWVDVLPLPQHSWSVEISPDGATYFLNYTPGDPRLPGPGPERYSPRARELGPPKTASSASRRSPMP